MRNDSGDNSGLDLYLAMSAAWCSRVPVSLAHEAPIVLARIIDLGLRKDGVSQSELQQELGINQSRMSKLTKKLVDEKWLHVNQSKTGSGKKFMATTAAARDLIASLKADMNALLAGNGETFSPQPRRSAPRAGGKGKPQHGQVPFELKE